MSKLVNLIHTINLYQKDNHKIIKNVLIKQYDYLDYVGSNLWDLINKDGVPQNITMSKYDLIGYFRGYDTQTKEVLIDVLSNLLDDDKILITQEEW